jgi:hypothetical protein
MKYIWAVSVAALVFLAGCSSGSSFTKPGYDFSQLNKVAVVEVTGARGDTGAQNEVADLFSMELLKRGFDVVERKQVDALLKEQQFQQGGATSRMDPVKLGEILNVQAVVIVNIPLAGEKISLTSKLIEVKTGSLLWMGEGTGNNKSGTATFAGALVGAGVGAVTGHAIGGNGSGALIGGVAGAGAGGIGGHLLEPAEAETLRKVVKKVCAGLPAKVAISN